MFHIIENILNTNKKKSKNLKKGSVSHQFVTVVQVTCLHQDTSRCLRDLWLIRHI